MTQNNAWHLDFDGSVLAEYSEEKIDLAKPMLMVLVHDLVEIDAGDTYAYDAVGNKTKRERELKAADRIFNILPEDQAEMLRSLWTNLKNSRHRRQNSPMFVIIFSL